MHNTIMSKSFPMSNKLSLLKGGVLAYNNVEDNGLNIPNWTHNLSFLEIYDNGKSIVLTVLYRIQEAAQRRDKKCYIKNQTLTTRLSFDKKHFFTRTLTNKHIYTKSRLYDHLVKSEVAGYGQMSDVHKDAIDRFYSIFRNICMDYAGSKSRHVYKLKGGKAYITAFWKHPSSESTQGILFNQHSYDMSEARMVLPPSLFTKLRKSLSLKESLKHINKYFGIDMFYKEFTKVSNFDELRMRLTPHLAKRLNIHHTEMYESESMEEFLERAPRRYNGNIALLIKKFRKYLKFQNSLEQPIKNPQELVDTLPMYDELIKNDPVYTINYDNNIHDNIHRDYYDLNDGNVNREVYEKRKLVQIMDFLEQHPKFRIPLNTYEFRMVSSRYQNCVSHYEGICRDDKKLHFIIDIPFKCSIEFMNHETDRDGDEPWICVEMLKHKGKYTVLQALGKFNENLDMEQFDFMKDLHDELAINF